MSNLPPPVMTLELTPLTQPMSVLTSNVSIIRPMLNTDLQSYSNGLSEVILGKAIKQHNLPRDEIVVMTKVFFAVGNPKTTDWTVSDPDQRGYVNQHGLSRKHIFDSVKNSLERLQLDYIDVLQCELFICLQWSSNSWILIRPSI
jgi:hypothetical protein